MWQRLKNSMMAMAISTMAVLAVTGLGERNQPTAEPMLATAQRLELDTQTQLALLIGAKLTAVVIDEVVREAQTAKAHAQAAQPARTAPSRDLRMPFYSFASRPARPREIRSMSVQWSDNTPIYLQLNERVVAMMLDGELKPGDALPSVRQVAADYQLNPITVSRAYQELADEALVEKRRGLGMYVTDGAPEKLLASERERFLRDEWPAMLVRIERLGLRVEELLRNAQPVGAGRA